MQAGMVQDAHGLPGSMTPSGSQLPQVCSAKLSAIVFLSSWAFHGECLSALPAFPGSTGKAVPGEMLPERRCRSPACNPTLTPWETCPWIFYINSG